MWRIPEPIGPVSGDRSTLTLPMEPHIYVNKFDPPPSLINAFFQAAKEADPEKLDEILKQGINPNIQDVEGKTALHHALTIECSCTTCIENAESSLVVILNSREADVNIKDMNGLTPLHIAAEHQLELCLKILIFKFGGDIYVTSNEGDQVIKIIAKKTPEIMCHILDRAISVDRGDPNTEKCIIKVDFRPVVGGTEPTGRCYVKKKLGKKYAAAEEEKYTCNELQLLRSLLNSGKFVRQKIFTHPAVMVFLDQKWRRVRKQFIGTFLCYVFWLLLYTCYVLYIYLIKCPCRFYNEALRSGRGAELERESENRTQEEALMGLDNSNSSTPGLNPNVAGFSDLQLQCLAAAEFSAAFFVLLGLTIIMAMNEVARIVVTPGLYFKSQLNILHWMLIFMVLGTFYPTFASQATIRAEQYQLAALTIFLGWSLILNQIGKFPQVGQYMEIFGHVLRHFWSFLLTYISLFIAFALAFCILFPGDQPYTIFPFAFLKIFVMMIGEMEYQDMFYSAEREEASGPLIGHVLYATFVIVVAIVLMNLLVGLTVSDIQGLQKEAELSRVSRQIMEMFHLEAFLYSDKLPHFIKKPIHKMTAVVMPLSSHHTHNGRPHSLTKTHEEPMEFNKFWYTFLPNDSRDKSVPERLKSAALAVAVRVQTEMKEKACKKKKCFIGKYRLVWGNEHDDATTPGDQDNIPEILVKK